MPDAAVVFGAADEDSDGFIVVAASEHVVDERDVDIEPANVFGLVLAGLELDNDVARLPQ